MACGLTAFLFSSATAYRTLHCNDFKHIYLGMQALASGDEPYSPASLVVQARRHGLQNADLNPYVYPPFTGLSLTFLAPLQFEAAAHVWFLLNLVFTTVSIWLIAWSLCAGMKDEPRRCGIGVLFGLVMLAIGLNHPYIRTLTAGQLTCVLLLCQSAAFAALRSRRNALAGGILGFAALFKLTPGLFLFYFLLRRRWHALASMAAACVILLGISLAFTGREIHARFLTILPQMGYGHSVWEEHNATFWKDPWNQSVNSFMTHIMVSGNKVASPWLAMSQQTANRLTIIVSALLCALFIWCVKSQKRTGVAGDEMTVADEAGYMGAIALALLLPSLMWDHYLLLLVLPASWLACYYGLRRRWMLLAVVCVLYGAASAPWHFDSPLFQAGWAVPLMSMKLFPVLGMYVMCCGAAKTENACRSPARKYTNVTSWFMTMIGNCR